MSALSPAPTAVLDSLAQEIRVEHEACESDVRSAVGHAIRCGELLAEAKAKVSHGAWLPWLGQNFPATVRTAQGYMKLAQEGNAQRVSHLPVRDALAELAEPRPTEPATPEPQPEAESDEPELVEAEVVEPSEPEAPRDPGPRVQCPTCGHMVKPDDIGTWRE